jgi:LysR family transcriptional regulator, transcriptional activator for bauABCD operon
MKTRRRVPDQGKTFARNIDWNLFKIFCEIAEFGGIGAAARALNKKQPTVSIALRRLEQQVGHPLFVRASTGVSLTSFGQQLQASLASVSNTICAIPEAAAATREPAEMVSLRVISNLSQLPNIGHILATFHHRFPRVEIKMDVTPWSLIPRSLREDEAEFGIGFETEMDPELIYCPLADEASQLYCGANHPLFGATKVDLVRLGDERFVSPRDEPREYVAFRRKHSLGRNVGAVADNLQDRMWLIALGIGIGILPTRIAETSDLADSLWPLAPPTEAPVATVFFMAKRHSTRSRAAAHLLETVRDRVPAIA